MLAAVLGALIGGFLGWPHKVPAMHGGPVPLLTPYPNPAVQEATYHNAFVNGRLPYIASVGVLAAYVGLLAAAALCYAAVRIYSSSIRASSTSDTLDIL